MTGRRDSRLRIYHANIVYARARDELVTRADSYIAVENETVEGIYSALPEKYVGAARDRGGSLFGKTGSLEPGYAFDVLVIRDFSDPFREITPAETVERFCYTGNPGDITARFIGGEAI